MTFKKRILLKTGIMFVVLLGLVITLSIYGSVDPRETYSFAQLFEFVATELVLGPSVLAILLVLAHDSMAMRRQRRRGWSPLTASVLTGLGLGLLLGSFWGLFTWGPSLVLLGLVVGGVYGWLVAVFARGRLLAPVSSAIEEPKAHA